MAKAADGKKASEKRETLSEDPPEVDADRIESVPAALAPLVAEGKSDEVLAYLETVRSGAYA